MCAFCLPNELGGLGWSKADFDGTDAATIHLVYNEAIKRSEEMDAKMKGKTERKKLPKGFRLPGEK